MFFPYICLGVGSQTCIASTQALRGHKKSCRDLSWQTSAHLPACPLLPGALGFHNSSTIPLAFQYFGIPLTLLPALSFTSLCKVANKNQLFQPHWSDCLWGQKCQKIYTEIIVKRNWKLTKMRKTSFFKVYIFVPYNYIYLFYVCTYVYYTCR